MVYLFDDVDPSADWGCERKGGFAVVLKEVKGGEGRKIREKSSR